MKEMRDVHSGFQNDKNRDRFNSFSSGMFTLGMKFGQPITPNINIVKVISSHKKLFF